MFGFAGLPKKGSHPVILNEVKNLTTMISYNIDSSFSLRMTVLFTF